MDRSSIVMRSMIVGVSMGFFSWCEVRWVVVDISKISMNVVWAQIMFHLCSVVMAVGWNVSVSWL